MYNFCNMNKRKQPTNDSGDPNEYATMYESRLLHQWFINRFTSDTSAFPHNSCSENFIIFSMIFFRL